MKKLSQEALVNFLLFIALLILTSSVGIAYWQIQRLQNANQWVVHSYQVIQKINTMLLALNKAEFAVHDYLTSGDKFYVAELPQTLQAVSYNLALAQDLTKDNFSQHQRVMKLSILVNEKIGALQTSAKMFSERNNQTLKYELNKEAKILFDSIIQLSNEIKSKEISILESRNLISESKAKMTNILVILSGTIGDVLLLSVFIVLVHNMRQRQLTEMKKIEVENQLKKIIDSSDDLIAALDLDGRFIAFNEAYKRKFKALFDKDIQVGMSLREMVPVKFHQEDIVRHWDRALNGEEFTSVMQLLLDEDNKHYYEATYNIIRDANFNPIGAAHIMRDITERKKVENLKNEFISIVSHELRTPLTSIRGSLAIVKNNLEGKIDDKSFSMLTIANNNCERLVKLINDILDIEKIETGKSELNKTTIDLNHLAEQAVAENQAYADKFNVKIKLIKNEVPILVQVDSIKLMQVFANLISNAIKFSPTDDEVTVMIMAEDGIARVSILDHGEGIPENFQKHIFEKFSQADSSAIRKQGGSGLGLSISKAIIDLHNGKIGFNSNKNNSTTIFYFELPLWTGNAVIQHGDSEATRPIKEDLLKVLYVEDDLDLSKVVTNVLHDADITCINNKRQIFKELSNKRYDLILLDLMLPDGSSIDLLADLSKFNIPIIVYTAYELPMQYAKYVKKVLIKSKTSNQDLINAIHDMAY